MIKVVLADDHKIVRHGLSKILSSESDISVVGEAQDSDEALALVRSKDVDVVVLDITMPGRSGLETLKELRKTRPELAVIVLSMHPADQYAVRVLRAGAAGYISKESAPDELVTAIQKAYQGEKYIQADVARLLARFIEHGLTEEPHKLLSDREYEVLRLIAAGKGITQISELMNLSVKTVSTYRSRIVAKTGLLSNAEMTRYAIEHSLV